MAGLSYVVSTVLMGLFVVLVVAAVLRGRDWYDYSPPGEEGGLAETAREVSESPVAWMVGFLLLVFVFGGATVLYLGDATLPVSAGTIGLVLAAAFALVLAGYAFVGAYSAARSRGRPASQAVAEGVVLLGLLLVVGIAVKLVAGA